MAKAAAQRIVRAIQAPVPTGDGRTLYVEGVPADKWDDHEYIRATVARYALRAALELNCTRIGVRHPHRGTLYFDVLAMIQSTALALGHYPTPGFAGVPRSLALTGFRAHGAEIAPTRLLFPVSTAFPVPPAPTGV